MLNHIFIIFLYQLIGELFQKYFSLTLPGPVVGLILLLLSLLVAKDKISNLGYSLSCFEKTSEKLISYLPIMFVPIGVGVVMHVSHLQTEIWKILIIIFFSTVLTIGLSAFIIEKVGKRNE